MAGSSLLALIDDIASILDDVSVLTKVAAKKTSGVLGDDLALNAEQVTGVSADRELPVVWAVAKGSFINKVILVPSALLLSFAAPFLILPLLTIGGLFLCFEGAEKVLEKFFYKQAASKLSDHNALANAADDSGTESDKIKGAIRTDFILSAEIIIITLGTVAAAAFTTQVLVLAGIAIAMTVGVYGLVAVIVKIDDFGLWLLKRSNRVAQISGRTLLKLAPQLMKALGILGTIAMFLVGGGILAHAVPPIHHFSESLSNPLLKMAVEGSLGFLAGLVVLALLKVLKKIKA